ncbi:MAG: CAP domain-containing protein, partial [Nitrosopumilaceae archaeon]
MIPSKIRDDGNYWIQGDIQDTDFAKDMQYLSIHGIIHIPQSNYQQTTAHIPSWVKHTVGWWLDGKIGDSELISAVQWLINQNIISVGVSENSGATSGQNASSQTNTPQSIHSLTENNNSQTSSPQLQQLYAYALKLVNDDRAKYGLAPVSLSNIASAQNHADDQLNVNYFSHWNSNGVK